MAKRSHSVRTDTPTATADDTALANDTYMGCLLGGSTTQITNILEIYMGGQAGASAPSIMVFGFNDIVPVTLVLGVESEDAPLHAATVALAAPVVVGVSAGTPPQRSSTLGAVLSLSFNAFGGIVRWLAAPGEEVTMVGYALDLGTMSLSAFTGGTTGLMSSHIIYETL